MEYRTLIDAKTLSQHLYDPDWVIIDTRFDLMAPDSGYQAYLAGHIPSAVYAHLDKDLSGSITPQTGRHPLPEIEPFQSICRAWGVTANSQVIVYDNSGGAIAARLWWMFRWLGHSKVAVLDGGIGAWEAHGYAFSTDIQSSQQGNFVAMPDPSLLVSTQDIEAILSSGSMTVIDVRDSERYQGLKEPIDSKKGHIPGAINQPFKSSLSVDGYFLSKQQLQEVFQPLMSQAQPLVCMCGSGVTACHTLLALEIAEIKGSRLYPGSWSEWIRDPSHPIEADSA